ncbi:LamG domain-containing protein [Gimesia maris]|uniref:LamG-like jellyroll fold domain-containing protein n=1 Tax=Gimesia maris TaxID=122 RepID=A0ABX5YZG5_9PLAN|nr:LamG domain-containing protein [Gimesia maris]EDL60556.1 thrombospondin N-terminal-like domain protein [Gimesia maris DSM 8797]QEG19929.1 hypothetical protein GmarT_58380 [Gimesia maris]QGQ27268.1 LamG domain-containing protein [Gimesia maris]
MATSHEWNGGAATKAQVSTFTIPSDIVAGNVITASIGFKKEPYTVPVGGTNITAAAGFVAVWNASTNPEFGEITASVGVDSDGDVDGSVVLTADTAGVPFVVTVVIGTGTNEKQLVTLTGATGGTFTLTWNGQTTDPIAYNASAATVQTELEALSNIDSGDVTVTGSNGGPYTVEFTGDLAATNVTLITASGTSLTGSANEEQTVTIINSPSGGDFTLTFNGQTTDVIAHNASAATVQSELEGLANIKVGDVDVTGSDGGPWTVEFIGDLAKTDVSLLVAASSLTGAPTAAAATSQSGSGLSIAGLKAYWKLDETSGDRADHVGANDFAELGTVVATTGILDKSATSFSDSNYLEVPHHTDLAPTGDFSISFWIRPSTTSAGPQFIICKGFTSGAASDGRSYNVYLYNDGIVFNCKATDGTTVSSSQASSIINTVTANSWNLVVVVADFNNEILKISVNNNTFETAALWDPDLYLSDSGLPLKLGVDENTEGNFRFPFIGQIDEVAIWDMALSQSDVSTLYNSGAGLGPPFTGINEIQTLTFTGTPTAGSVGVSFRGSKALIPHDSTAAEAEALLEALDTIGTGNVNVTGGDWPGTALSVEFINDLAQSDQPQLVVDNTAVHVSIAESVKGVPQPTVGIETTDGPIDITTVTANEGPNDWNTAANWNTNKVPITGDTVYVSETNVNILYGLDQSDVTLAALIIEQTFTGDIGLPRTNAAGSYPEYRDQYLKIGATLLNIGDKQGDGSERIKINLGSVQSTVLITNSGDSPDGNTPAILLLGTHASNAININRGSLGVAYYPTEVATVATLRQAFFDNAADDTNVYLGSGVSVTDIVKSGGVLDINSATTTFKQTAGTTTIHAGAHAVLNILAGLVNYNSTGTLSAVNLSGDGVLVFDQDARPKDVTIINKFTDDSEIYDESGSITSPVIDLEKCGDLSTLHMGQDFKLTFGATT